MPQTLGPPTFWHEDTSPAAWLGDNLGPWGENVGSIVPRGFEAYARVLHPVGRGDYPGMQLSRWADIARSNGRVSHPAMQFHNIIHHRGAPSASPDHMPAPGALPVHERELLVELLERETTSPARCWFCLWEGWGSIDDRGVKARVELTHRRYLLYSGPVAAALAVPPQSASGGGVAFSQWAPPGEPVPEPLSRESKERLLAASWAFGPALWWPEDRAWVVATEIDCGWTYVGGKGRTIERLLAHPELETWPANLSDRFSFDSDGPNAQLDVG